MTDKKRPDEESAPTASVSTTRRAAMKTLVWAAPVVVATATLNARAAAGTCAPNTPPED